MLHLLSVFLEQIIALFALCRSTLANCQTHFSYTFLAFPHFPPFHLSLSHSASCPSFLFPPYLFCSFPHVHLTSVQYFHFSSFQHSSFLHFYLILISIPPIPALHLSSFPLFLYFFSPISFLSPLLLFPALLSTFSFLFYSFPLFHLSPFLLSSFPLFATHAHLLFFFFLFFFCFSFCLRLLTPVLNFYFYPLFPTFSQYFFGPPFIS
jgi:hypothetical protein